MAKELKAAHFAEDTDAVKFIENGGLRAIFNVLVKISYGLFGLGIVFTIGDGTLS